MLYQVDGMIETEAGNDLRIILALVAIVVVTAVVTEVFRQLHINCLMRAVEAGHMDLGMQAPTQVKITEIDVWVLIGN
ncbi:hypothetical protein ECC18A13_p10450 (plasmid) [Enterobacter sp. 18A13]|nr:hypothetical protein ECC18A13_p10450 [Enterobacter sp. 18A13]